LHKGYLQPIREAVAKTPELSETVAGFLIRPSRIVLYFCPNHIVVEYEGPERADPKEPENKLLEITAYDYADDGEGAFDKVVGFTFADGTSGFRMPLLGPCQDLLCPTNRGLSKLLKLGWNIGAQDHLMTVNSGGWKLVEGKFARIMNSFFFDASKNGLTTRHIKWADCFPIRRVDDGDSLERWLSTTCESNIQYRWNSGQPSFSV